MLLFYYFKEVIHSPVHQSKRESEAANGQWFWEEPHAAPPSPCLPAHMKAGTVAVDG